MGLFHLHENQDKIELPIGGAIDSYNDNSLSLNFSNQNFAIIKIPCNMRDKSKVVFRLNCKVKKGSACKLMCYSHLSKTNTILGTDVITLDKTNLRLILQLHLLLPDDIIIFKIQPKVNRFTELIINEFTIQEITPNKKIPIKSIPLFTPEEMKQVILKEKHENSKKHKELHSKMINKPQKLNPNVQLSGLGLDKTLDRLKNRKLVRGHN
jgi:hypothetical protein